VALERRGRDAAKGIFVMECFAEPTLDEVLSDPMVMEVMASDGVDPAELETALVAIAGDIRQRAQAPEVRSTGARLPRGRT
jgi:hypothetical protein